MEQLLEEIELLDGASAEFDLDLVSKRRTDSGIFRIRTDQLWRGDFSSAFPGHDYTAACRERLTQGMIDPVEHRLFCLCI